MGPYLITVTAAALICAIAVKAVKNGTIHSLIRLLCGVFMALTVVSPWLKIRIDSLSDITSVIWNDASAAAGTGEKLAREAMVSYIKEKTQAYILDKAKVLGVSLDVEVTVSGDDIPIPEGVIVTGAVSPYNRSILTDYIRENLGIDTEAQIWRDS